ITEQGTLAGRLLLSALDGKDLSYAKKAKEIYETIIPTEHYGGEYTALEWFCDYLLGNEESRKQQLADRYHESFFEFFSGNDFLGTKKAANSNSPIVITKAFSNSSAETISQI